MSITFVDMLEMEFSVRLEKVEDCEEERNKSTAHTLTLRRKRQLLSF
jgi:hypothetical protein